MRTKKKKVINSLAANQAWLPLSKVKTVVPLIAIMVAAFRECNYGNLARKDPQMY
jgi:hypothetical protein